MKLTDRRLYQARNLQDFRFRLFYEENERPERLQRAIATALIEPNYFLVWGTDHSDWDGNVEFEVTKGLGSRFVFIKAMEGTVPSKYYIRNTLRAKEVGLLDAPYHWLHQNSKVNCKLQAQAFWERTKPFVSKLPAMVDFEWTKYMGQWANPTYNDLDIWVTEYTRLSGIKPLYYSAMGYMNDQGKMPLTLREKFIGFVVASYGSGLPAMPFGFGPMDWEFHQFASYGNAEIISPNDAGKKEVDLTYSILRPAEFDEKYGTVGPIPVPDPVGGTMFFKVTYASLNLRSSAAVLTTNDLGNSDNTNLKLHDIIETENTSVTQGGYTWRRVLRWWRANVEKQLPVSPTGEVWAAEKAGATGYYMVQTNFTPPTPQPVKVIQKAVIHFTDGTTQELLPSGQ